MSYLAFAVSLVVIAVLKAHGIPWLWALAPVWMPAALASMVLLLMVAHDIRRRRGKL